MNKNPRSHFTLQVLVIFGAVCILGLMNSVKLHPFNPVEASGLQYVYLPIARNLVPTKTHFGTEMNPISNSQGLQKMSQAGASWVRRNAILWSDIEPIQGGGYDWSSLGSIEQDFLRARENNMEVVAIIRGIPDWALMPPYNYACGPINPSALPAFGNFIHAVVQRYSGSPYYVKYWEIWNEPDVDPSNFPHGDYPFGCMGDVTDTAYYGGQYFATVLQAAYPMAKAANPEAQVMVGGLLMNCDPLSNPEGCIPSRYLEGILVAGGQNYFDGVSFHAYDFFSIGAVNYPTGIYGNPGWNSGGYENTLSGALKPALVAKVHYIKYLFGLYNVQGKFLMNTETALLCGGTFDPPGGTGCESSPDSAFEKLKAAYIPQTYASALAEGLVANIWFTPLGWRNSGLLKDDLTTRPAYEAFQLANDILGGATFVREIHEYEDNQIFGYEFLVENQTIWILWTLDGKMHPLTFAQLPVTVQDELGLSTSFAGGILTVQGLKTYYVNWGP